MNDSISNDRILAALRDARLRLEAHERAREERIAIVGMAGRFPGAEDVDALWDLLVSGHSGMRRLSEEELAAAGIPAAVYRSPDYVPVWASFEQPEAFDAAFFGYAPREAELLDPQQRVFLECAWHALEDAGYDTTRYAGRIGVYGGAALGTYVINLHNDARVRAGTDTVQAVVSNVLGLMPTRVSYHLGLTGPSCGIQTGCSTSLVAVHFACRSLLERECDMALAGGVTVSDPIPHGYAYQPGSITSPDGRCRAFDARGGGTVFGNGAGIVVLKRLSDALADGDHVYAVIRGSAVNNDGADKVGLIAPSVSGQAAVIRAALAAADVDPATLGYIEAHGTATALGDPVEVAALHKALGPGVENRAAPIALGSIKSNLGHLDAAAGVAGLIKTALALRHAVLPPSLDFSTPNPEIDFASGALRVNTELRPWPRGDAPRRAGVSSFGMGGTNAHAVLEEAPQADRPASLPARAWQIVPLSARNEAALEASGERLSARLRNAAADPLGDVAFTLQQGRRQFAHRRACVAGSSADASALLTGGDGARRFSGQVAADPPQVVFLFPGQGSQRVGMARALYDAEPAYRAAFDACAEVLGERVPLRHLVYPAQPGDDHEQQLRQTAYAQPALFAIEYALAQLWMSWGVHPAALVGHSVGEYVAACLAGVFSLRDALTLVALRGELMQRCAPGAMLAVAMNESELAALLPPELDLSAVNGPRQCVVGGPGDAVARFQASLETRGVTAQLLATSHAFHSRMMEPALAGFGEALRTIELHAPGIDLISGVSGDWLSAAEATDPGYWMRQLRGAVRFGDGVRAVAQRARFVGIEVGPGSALGRLAAGVAHTTVVCLPEGRDAGESMALALAKAWTAGVAVDWAAYASGRPQHRLPLPGYPFQRERYWIALRDAPASEPPAARPASAGKAADPSDWFHVPLWRASPRVEPAALPADGGWLVFAPPALRNGLAPELGALPVVWVEPGSAPDFDGEALVVRPGSIDDAREALRRARAAGPGLTQVVYAWPAGADHASADALSMFRAALAIVQGLRAEPDGASVILSLVTAGACSPAGGEPPRPEQAALAGLFQVAGQETPGLGCRHIDLGPIDLDPGEGSGVRPSQSAGWRAGALQDLTEALLQPWCPAGRHVALRAGMSWLRDYQQLRLPAPVAAPLRTGAAYAIVGDLAEGLGTIFARALAQRCGARLALLGPRALPEPAQWEAWLATHGPRHPVSALVRSLQQLRQAGTELRLYRGELADPAWLEASLAEAAAELGPIRGIFHVDAMGDRAACPLAAADATATSEQVFATRVSALRALASASRGSTQLDFVVLQSSLSVVVGGEGFAAYAAATTYADALAAAHAGAVPWVAVDWDAVHRDEDSESAGAGSALMAAAFTADEVWTALERILARPRFAQVVLTPVDLAARLAQAFDPNRAQPGAAAGSRAQGHGRPAIATPYVAPRTDTERMVAQAMGELLGIDQVGAEDDFFDLGGHSLLAIQAVTRLRKDFGVELPMRALLFEARTAAGIAAVIDRSRMPAADGEPAPAAQTPDEQPPDEQVEALLASVERMAPDEVARRLQPELGP